MKSLGCLHQHHFIPVYGIVTFIIHYSYTVLTYNYRDGRSCFNSTRITAANKFFRQKTSHPIMYKNYRIILYQFQPVLDGLKSCITTGSHPYFVFIEPGINDLLSNVCIINRQYKNYLNIGKRIQKYLKGIVKNRFVIDQ